MNWRKSSVLPAVEWSTSVSNQVHLKLCFQAEIIIYETTAGEITGYETSFK